MPAGFVAVTALPVHVIIVNWNAIEETVRCLQSLSQTEPPPQQIHVVDNGSEHDEAARLAESFPNVRVHALASNTGFAGGSNVGIRHALAEGAKFVFLLNNDARVDRDTIRALVDAASRHPSAGLIGPRIWRDRARDVLWACGVRMGFGPNLGQLRGFNQLGQGRYLNDERVDSLTGCGLLVRREVFEAIGVLDESYFVYVEDADFAARAREAGFDCLYVSTAHLEHPGGYSTGGGYAAGRKYLTAHGATRYLKRHGRFINYMSWITFDVVLWPFLLVLALFRGELRAAWAKGMGTLHGVLGLAPRPPSRTRSS